MKRVFKVLLAIVLLLMILLGVFVYANRPLTQEEVNQALENHLSMVVQNNESLSSALMTVYSGKTGYLGQFAVGTVNHDSTEPVNINSQYHSASIGKTMCATLYGMLVDEGAINFDDKISRWLEKDLLDGLFVVNGVDYQDQVTIRQLLTHTSGVADFFVGPVTKGPTMLQLTAVSPDRRFTPYDLVAFTRENQTSVGKPGEVFNYSDTGYMLLGFLIEKLEGKPYSQVLRERIFEPLGMKDSYLLADEPERRTKPILGVYINQMDWSDKAIASIDWSNGGIVTTMDDLLLFMKALTSGRLVSDAVFKQMTDFSHQFDKGIRYGMGMMYFDFSELSPLLGGMSDVYGGVGSTGTFMLYDQEAETFFIGNYGSIDFMKKSIEDLVQIKMLYNRLEMN